MKEENKLYFQGLITGGLIVVSCILCFNSYHAVKNYIGLGMDNKQKAKYIQRLIDNFYVDDISEDDLYEGIFSGMVGGPTDRYSYYMDKDSYLSFKDNTNGNYLGIGVLVTIDPEDYKILVNSVFEGSPSETAGIEAGDKIVKIDGIDVSYSNYSDAIAMMKGEEGTTVNITIFRPSQEKNINLTVERGSVDVPTVASTMLEDNIGYIMISQFDGVTSEQFTTAFDKLQQEGMTGLVLDLRNNPGGLLTTVKDVANKLLPAGVLTYTEDKSGNKAYEYTDGEGMDIPLAVLINGNSASASELLAGAVKDLNQGTIIGTTSYGKGVVQTIFPVGDGSAVKLTTSKYYTPSGVCINGIGVEPDIYIEPNEELEVPVTTNKDFVLNVETDNQLQKAIEVVKK